MQGSAATATRGFEYWKWLSWACGGREDFSDLAIWELLTLS